MILNRIVTFMQLLKRISKFIFAQSNIFRFLILGKVSLKVELFGIAGFLGKIRQKTRFFGLRLSFIDSQSSYSQR